MKKIKILYKFYDWNVIFYDFAFAYDAFLTKKTFIWSVLLQICSQNKRTILLMKLTFIWGLKAISLS